MRTLDPANDEDTMADDQQLWGYPEIAAHLGISVGAARSRMLVEALADRWGCSPCACGGLEGTVWAEFNSFRGSLHPTSGRRRIGPR
ncbi:hypothetical protein [Streptomyces sp. 13-12-16]|uniref:hypothetical protein n=1 Tax=Streptomyces sp. 13-12-16 TaxID=1570823 RepID=UPI00211A8DF7|nr:hypothetical protein [Streptomyces sp. 13-12-16]